MYSYYPNRKETNECIKNAMFDLRDAFCGLFKAHEYELSEKVFDALDALSIVSSDLGESQNVWRVSELDKEISQLLEEAECKIAEAKNMMTEINRK